MTADTPMTATTGISTEEDGARPYGKGERGVDDSARRALYYIFEDSDSGGEAEVGSLSALSSAGKARATTLHLDEKVV